jgi:hypothetical protein
MTSEADQRASTAVSPHRPRDRLDRLSAADLYISAPPAEQLRTNGYVAAVSRAARAGLTCSSHVTLPFKASQSKPVEPEFGGLPLAALSTIAARMPVLLRKRDVSCACAHRAHVSLSGPFTFAIDNYLLYVEGRPDQSKGARS